ncbi:MAG: hypothetical protein L6367_11195, partial [Cellulomonas sp.]|nr:hypothetical protein [Cellulomonas sp.]
MSAENWRELLWQDGIEDVVLRAVRAVEAADRRAARGSVGDYESFAWDAAVEIATKYSGDTATFDRWLYYGLTRFAVQSNRDQRFGKPGSPRRNGAYAVSFDDREDGGDGQGAEASASLTSHRITPDDPLALLLRIERLERAVRQAVIKEGSDRRLTYVTRTGDDLCIEPMCLRKAETQGRCVRHYAQHYQRWGRADGSSPTCANGGCNAVATSRGLCHPHYIEDRARQIAAGTWQPVSHPTACSVEGCERPHAAKGLCATHWKRLRTTGTTDDPPPP